MTHAIRIHQNGGPEVLTWEEVEVAPPGPGQAVVSHTAVGLNFIDTYHRAGLHKLPLPAIIGQEGAGVVSAVGAGVTEVKVGDRVVYAGLLGGYAEARIAPADRLVPIPAGVPDEHAAAAFLRGLTARYLLRQTHPVKSGETILVHAGAGGVGLFLTRWAKHLGAAVITTVGSDAKAEISKAAGADHVIVYTRENFVERALEITGGAKLPVVYDSVGRDTYAGSLDCLRPRGLAVFYGNSSGAIPPFELGLLAAKGSLFITRPTLGHHVATRAELLEASAEYFDLVASGVLPVEIGGRFALKDAAQAHAALEGRKIVGASVLIP